MLDARLGGSLGRAGGNRTAGDEFDFTLAA
jgi:hypothetical protein